MVSKLKKIVRPTFSAIHNLSIATKIELELVMVTFVVIAGAWGFHRIEGWRMLDSIYFTVATITTVGFGDFVPKTDIGKILTTLYALTGIPLFIYTGSLVLENRLSKIRKFTTGGVKK